MLHYNHLITGMWSESLLSSAMIALPLATIDKSVCPATFDRKSEHAHTVFERNLSRCLVWTSVVVCVMWCDVTVTPTYECSNEYRPISLYFSQISLESFCLRIQIRSTRLDFWDQPKTARGGGRDLSSAGYDERNPGWSPDKFCSRFFVFFVFVLM